MPPWPSEPPSKRCRALRLRLHFDGPRLGQLWILAPRGIKKIGIESGDYKKAERERYIYMVSRQATPLTCESLSGLRCEPAGALLLLLLAGGGGSVSWCLGTVINPGVLARLLNFTIEIGLATTSLSCLRRFNSGVA